MLVPKAKKKVARNSIVEAVESVLEVEEEQDNTGAPTKEVPLQQITTIDPSVILAKIAKELKFTTFEPAEQFWLDTGNKDANSVFGTRELGIPYGKIIELAGIQHGGKTTLSTVLAGMAQKEGAGVGYIDLEFSSDKEWAAKLGLNLDYVTVIKPKLISEKKGSIPRLQSGEEIFSEAETGMRLLADAGCKKQFWILDSIANITTAMVLDAGATGQNMRTNADRAQFLSKELPKLAGLAANYNATISLVNQVRTKVGFVMGSPEYMPGGNALDHACSSRVRVRRLKNGQLRHNGKVIGLVGIIRNTKNKVGHGSVQSEEAGFQVLWNRKVAKVEFMSKSDAEDLIKGEREE